MVAAFGLRYAYARGRALHARADAARQSRVSAQKFEQYDTDFVVLGAGIIGLACARELLQSDPNASVTVVEQADELCSQATGAATGAGQG